MSDADSSAANDSPAGDVKAKMREALEAKKRKQQSGEAHLDNGGDAQASPHGPVDAKRVYRRKTG